MRSIRQTIALCLVLCAVLPLSGCSRYCVVSRTHPESRTSSKGARLLAQDIEWNRRHPVAALGYCLDHAAAAERRLRTAPDDAEARAVYNFAVSRVIDLLQVSKLEPWDAPVSIPGHEGKWRLTFENGRHAKVDPRHVKLVPTDHFEFFGTYVKARTLKEGIGAPLVIGGRDEDVPQTGRLAQGRNVYYGLTGLLRFEGRNCVLTTEDPLAVENVRFAGRTFPLAADFTAPLALAVSQEKLWIFALQRLLRPQSYVDSAKILRLQPYHPSKIPVICLHGLVDSPSTWMPIVNTLRGDADIRKRYQFWFFSYPSGYPYPYIATIMRQQLDLMKQRYPDHKKAVLIGHSMGGSISRTMITDSGMKLWNAYFAQPPKDLAVSSTVRDVLSESLIFKPRPEVGRVIFLAVPHRGSEKASTWFVKVASKLVKIPSLLLNIAEETHYLITTDQRSPIPSQMPNSIETLAPNHRFLKAINDIPLSPGVPFHSIMGDRGKGGNKDRTKPESNDGYVPYWSSHLDGAKSEMIVPSDHSVQHDPKAIEEIRRILRLHGR